MSEMRRERDATGEEATACVPRAAGGAFQLLLAANPLPMLVYDLETLRFVEVNEALVAHYGCSRRCATWGSRWRSTTSAPATRPCRT